MQSLNDFASLKGHGLSRTFSVQELKTKDTKNKLNRFFDAVKNGKPGPMPIDRILGATQISLTIDDRVRNNNSKKVR